MCTHFSLSNEANIIYREVLPTYKMSYLPSRAGNGARHIHRKAKYHFVLYICMVLCVSMFVCVCECVSAMAWVIAYFVCLCRGVFACVCLCFCACICIHKDYM